VIVHRWGNPEWRWLLSTAVVTLSACAAPSGVDTSETMPPSAVPVTIGVGGALPTPEGRGDPMLASRVGIGGDQTRWRYEANYFIEPGELFTTETLAPGADPPQRLGGQRLGQAFSMRLPDVGGAPVALLVSSEAREYWTTAGERRDQQRQQASVGWSPSVASLNLQWVGGDGAVDPRHALGCELLGKMEMPLGDSPVTGRQSLRLSGRECRVRSGDPRYQGLAAEAWGVGLAWKDATRETEVLLAMIDPASRAAPGNQDIDASYELGVSPRLAHGPWSVRTLVAMRYTTAWDFAAPSDSSGAYLDYSDSFLTASASLTRHLPVISLSANWAHSADPLWFMPEIGERKHRFDVRMDLSRLMATVMPDAATQLSMHWHWYEARSRTDAVTADAAVRLNMAVVW
jgi:hypothetical protein